MRLEEKFARMDLKRIRANDLANSEECSYVMLELDIIIAEIEHQLGLAKADAIENSNYADATWFHNAKHALKSAKRSRLIAQERKGEFTRLEKRSRATTESETFILAARELLNRETYTLLWDSVRKRMGPQ